MGSGKAEPHPHLIGGVNPGENGDSWAACTQLPNSGLLDAFFSCLRWLGNWTFLLITLIFSACNGYYSPLQALRPLYHYQCPSIVSAFAETVLYSDALIERIALPAPLRGYLRPCSPPKTTLAFII